MAFHDELLDLAIRLVGAPSVAPAPVAAAGPPAPAAPAATIGSAPTAAFPVYPFAPATPANLQVDLRRGISTAYYALFHLLVDAATTRGVATVTLRPYVARNFEHRQRLVVCKRYFGLAVDITGQPVPAEVKRVADYFVHLQNARHKADYNVKDSVTAAEAQNFVQMAQNAFADWAAVAGDPAADTYLTELLVGGIKER
jgi:hypothetical protein